MTFGLQGHDKSQWGFRYRRKDGYICRKARAMASRLGIHDPCHNCYEVRCMLEFLRAVEEIREGLLSVYLVRLEHEEPIPWRPVDQAAVIPAISKDEMAIALYTAVRAVQLFPDGAPAAGFHDQLRPQFARRLSLTSALSWLLITMHSLTRAVRWRPSILSDLSTVTRLSRTPYGARSIY